APAYSEMAACYCLLGDYGWLPAPDASAKAKYAVQKALRSDPNSAEAHATLGLILSTYDPNWDQAGKEFREAIRLNPYYAEARHWYAWYLAVLGRSDEAIKSIELAAKLDPLSHIMETNKGKILYYAGQNDKAIRCLNEVVH